MAEFHHDEPTCEYSVGCTPVPGDVVTLCTATAPWRVDRVEPDGKVTLAPMPAPGWTWRGPITVTPEHIDPPEPQGGLW